MTDGILLLMYERRKYKSSPEDSLLKNIQRLIRIKIGAEKNEWLKTESIELD